ncbi:thioredoxin family protein [Polaribacter sp.]|uniref:thioredoxin family protein n=1 Tax=Polaribacter sp. TaxID=1920175 RepID=UPI003F4BC8B6
MKTFINTILLLFLIQIGNAQEVEMITEWKEAKELAKKENKRILIILTGSEWCAPCKKMDKKVIENSEFEKYAEQNLIVFLIDLPGGGLVINSKVYQDYEKFENKYQTNALPSLILTENNGTKIRTLKGKMFRFENVMKQLKSE